MNAIRFGTALVGALCLAGTALGQTTNPLRDDPYAVRLTRLDDDSSRSSYAYDDPSSSYTTPATKVPVQSIAATGTASNAPPAPTKANPDNSNSYDQSMKGNCWDSGCSLPACACNNEHWYAYVGGLTMGRDMPNKFWTTYDQNNISHQLLYFPGADWGGGVDTRIGYWFGCGNCGDPCGCCNSCGPTGRAGMEVVYWGVWGANGAASITDTQNGAPNSLGTVINEGGVYFLNPAAGGDAGLWYDNASEVRLTRNDNFNNVEVNFLYMPCCDAHSRFDLTAIAGIRYFRFSDNLQWDQFAGTGLPGGDPNEAILNTDVTNNLVGFQIGTYMNYQVGNRLSIFAIPKIGIYGNHIDGANNLALSDGTTARFVASGDALNFNNTKNVFSMLGSIDLGFNWAFNDVWSLNAGYRVVMATDMALGDNQIPFYFADEAGWKTIKSNGDLILHGAFAGLEARF